MKIVYYSSTGNTKRMAELIAEGIEAAGKNAELLDVESITADDIVNEEIIILGCPASGAEVLEEEYMEPLVKSLNGKIDGKKVALFGTWGWGNGEWMTEWEERMKSYGANLISEGFTYQESPEDAADECRNFGKLIAQNV